MRNPTTTRIARLTQEVGKKGDVQEALGNAIAEAEKAMPGADRQVRWTLKKVSGVKGGIDPLNIATVEIEVAQS